MTSAQLRRNRLGRIQRRPSSGLVEPSYATFPRIAELVDIASSLTAVDLLQLVSLVLNDKTMTLRADSAKELDTLARIARLGLRPGTRFDPSYLTDAQRQVADAALSEAKKKATEHTFSTLKDVNGWVGSPSSNWASTTTFARATSD